MRWKTAWMRKVAIQAVFGSIRYRKPIRIVVRDATGRIRV
jgi:hypothetical protein